jgi:hypothetical protein
VETASVPSSAFGLSHCDLIPANKMFVGFSWNFVKECFKRIAKQVWIRWPSPKKKKKFYPYFLYGLMDLVEVWYRRFQCNSVEQLWDSSDLLWLLYFTCRREGTFAPFSIFFVLRRWVKNYQQCRCMFCSWLYCWFGMTRYTWSTGWAWQATHGLLVGHDKIHMVYSSLTIVVQVWPWQSISVMSFVP